VGRGIRQGLRRCSVCGTAHDGAGLLCQACRESVERGERDALKARNLAYLAGRFGPIVRKNPELVAAAIERRFGT
jgi:hypothetical protein